MAFQITFFKYEKIQNFLGRFDSVRIQLQGIRFYSHIGNMGFQCEVHMALGSSTVIIGLVKNIKGKANLVA